VNLARIIRALTRLLAAGIIFLVRLYQGTLSPLLGGQCRFQPTCSHYLIEAVQKHGAMKGVWLGLWRLLRCHPFSRGGYDPVP
jgi:putative membrane protein insertion efficiency factor